MTPDPTLIEQVRDILYRRFPTEVHADLLRAAADEIVTTLQGSAALPREAITLTTDEAIAHARRLDADEATTPTAPDQDAGASANADQALAVPVEPVARLDPSGFDPSRSMVSYGPDHPDYPNAPSDWDGGPYLCRDGQFYHMRGYGWEHGLGCWNATASYDRIAYHAAIATERAETPKSGSVHEGAGPEDIAHD